MANLKQIDEAGRARMVDISEKATTEREARASGKVIMRPETIRLIMENKIEKGDVLEVARVAGIMSAKRTWELIPLCHPLMITHADVQFFINEAESALEIESRVVLSGKTGVEMEALTAVAVAALTVYDMCKAVDKEMVIGDIKLLMKRGGKSGLFIRKGYKDRMNP